MTAWTLLEECRRLDIHLQLEGGNIRVRARDPGVPAQLRELLTRHKAGLVDLLAAAATKPVKTATVAVPIPAMSTTNVAATIPRCATNNVAMENSAIAAANDAATKPACATSDMAATIRTSTTSNVADTIPTRTTTYVAAKIPTCATIDESDTIPAIAANVAMSPGMMTTNVAAPNPAMSAANVATFPGISATTLARTESTPVFVDLETRSRCPIESGGRQYAADPSTQILSVVVLADDTVIVWTPLFVTPISLGLISASISTVLPMCATAGPLKVTTFAGPQLPASITRLASSGRLFCAHNGYSFDRHIWQAHALPEPAGWLDTLPLARACGLPGKLDKVCPMLFGCGKMPGSEALIDRLCKPQRNGQFVEPTFQEMTQLTQYNAIDVALLMRLFGVLKDAGEADVIAVDQAINDRGIYFDSSLATALIRLDEQHENVVAQQLVLATGGEVTIADINRVPFLLDWLRRRGVDLPNLQRKTLESWLERARATVVAGGRVDSAAAWVIEGRLACARTATGKLSKALEVVESDGRLRDQLVYHSAHTGRWAGRGVQVQNLPRPHHELPDADALIPHVSNIAHLRSVLPETVGIADAVSGLIRPCFRAAPGRILCIADFASIEARGLAWIAGVQPLLDRFVRGDDVYCEFASRLYGFPVTPRHKPQRAVGKIAVLGCGYAMSARRFAEYADDFGIDLSAAGVTPEQVVDSYRDAYPEIAGYRVSEWSTRRVGGLWNDVEDAAFGAVETGYPKQVGRCRFESDGSALRLLLPNSRAIWHPRRLHLNRMSPLAIAAASRPPVATAKAQPEPVHRPTTPPMIRVPQKTSELILCRADTCFSSESGWTLILESSER